MITLLGVTTFYQSNDQTAFKPYKPQSKFSTKLRTIYRYIYQILDIANIILFVRNLIAKTNTVFCVCVCVCVVNFAYQIVLNRIRFSYHLSTNDAEDSILSLWLQHDAGDENENVQRLKFRSSSPSTSFQLVRLRFGRLVRRP